MALRVRGCRLSERGHAGFGISALVIYGFDPDGGKGVSVEFSGAFLLRRVITNNLLQARRLELAFCWEARCHGVFPRVVGVSGSIDFSNFALLLWRGENQI